MSKILVMHRGRRGGEATVSTLPPARRGCMRQSQQLERAGDLAGPSQALTAQALPPWIFKSRGAAQGGKASFDNSRLRQGREVPHHALRQTRSWPQWNTNNQ